MPKQLDEFEFKPSAAGVEKYSRELLDGTIWQCFQGEDFTCQPTSFAQTMYNFAKKNGKKVRCRVLTDGSVVIQAYDRPAADAAADEGATSTDAAA